MGKLNFRYDTSESSSTKLYRALHAWLKINSIQITLWCFVGVTDCPERNFNFFDKLHFQLSKERCCVNLHILCKPSTSKFRALCWYQTAQFGIILVRWKRPIRTVRECNFLCASSWVKLLCLHFAVPCVNKIMVRILNLIIFKIWNNDLNYVRMTSMAHQTCSSGWIEKDKSISTIALFVQEVKRSSEFTSSKLLMKKSHWNRIQNKWCKINNQAGESHAWRRRFGRQKDFIDSILGKLKEKNNIDSTTNVHGSEYFACLKPQMEIINSLN